MTVSDYQKRYYAKKKRIKQLCEAIDELVAVAESFSVGDKRRTDNFIQADLVRKELREVDH